MVHCPLRRNNLHYKPGGREDGKTEMTMEEFTKFLFTFDANKDGLISREELREALKNSGNWFAKWKANRRVKYADTNGDGVIDKDEIPKLAEFAERELNIRIVSY